MIEIRRVNTADNTFDEEEVQNIECEVIAEGCSSRTLDPELPTEQGIKKSNIPPVLFGVVEDGEAFDFCMCNPPFFESVEQGGLNPKTSCGGTPEEMVCPGGEHEFITHIIKDSAKMKQTFRFLFSIYEFSDFLLHCNCPDVI